MGRSAGGCSAGVLPCAISPIVTVLLPIVPTVTPVVVEVVFWAAGEGAKALLGTNRSHAPAPIMRPARSTSQRYYFCCIEKILPPVPGARKHNKIPLLSE